MIKVSDIKFTYSASNPISFPDFAFEQGEHALVLGQSGCGKTTLLHLLAGLISPDQGTIQVAGVDISNMSGGAMDKFRGANIGVIFQKPHFVKALNVVENIQLAQKLSGGTSDMERARQILSALGLEHKLKSKVTELSEGEKQRVSIARALVNNPKVILADEPTSALDDTNCNAVLELLTQVSKKANSTLLIVTHDNRLKNQFSNKVEL